MNKCECVLVVKQYGSNVAMELQPGESRPLHWADGSLEATLSVSVISQAPGSTAATLMDWSGPVGIGHIGTFPICIRPMPGGAALPGKVEFKALDGQRRSHTLAASSKGVPPSLDRVLPLQQHFLAPVDTRRNVVGSRTNSLRRRAQSQPAQSAPHEEPKQPHRRVVLPNKHVPKRNYNLHNKKKDAPCLDPSPPHPDYFAMSNASFSS